MARIANQRACIDKVEATDDELVGVNIVKKASRSHSADCGQRRSRRFCHRQQSQRRDSQGQSRVGLNAVTGDFVKMVDSESSTRQGYKERSAERSKHCFDVAHNRGAYCRHPKKEDEAMPAGAGAGMY